MVQEIIQHQDEFYILASSPRVDDRTRVLKQGDTFAVLDRYGDIDSFGGGELGLYHEGTRFACRLTLKIFDRRPLLLSSTVKLENDLMAVDLTNHVVSVDGRVLLPRGSIHLFRSKFLWNRCCYERIRLRNYALTPVQVPLVFLFDADFADIFEVRGQRRPRRGRRLASETRADEVKLAYEGLDGSVRRTRLEWTPAPSDLAAGRAAFDLTLEPHQERSIYLTVSCQPERPSRRQQNVSYDAAYDEATAALRSAGETAARIYTSNARLNDWLNRSSSDLLMMLTATEHGPYPYAGVPWFSTAFGRDGIITAIECLWLDPNIARGVLSYLAATQAEEESPERDAEPGKILHETRKGEMAALGEIPFGRYYGTVDATPLFVVLASMYYEWTGDRELIESIWPHIDRALRWIDSYGDRDGDGFVEYARRAEHGLLNQGWKDSNDSVFHADGSLAEGPIALCEVQGYVYGAKRGGAGIARALGHQERASQLSAEAAELKERFAKAFWCEDLGTYALALDGNKRPCRVRTSNAGHCLFTGIASRDHATRVVQSLLSDALFSGWGVRTVSAGEARYNPMSYHNGSVWPHDNALIALGLARYGFSDPILKLFTALFDVSIFADLNRLPELYCGFVRRPGEGPTLYPLACSPQAWAAGSAFAMLQACLGMTAHGTKSQLTFYRPLLPESVESLEIRGLRVGSAVVDVNIVRYPRDAGINVTRREGDLEVLVVK